MPTIAQLPPAPTVSSADELPISQNGTVRATTVGTLLAGMQPAIVVSSPSLVGRISLGSGSPEEITIGVGLNITSGTITATGLDHATFPIMTALSETSDFVVSEGGVPYLVEASLLRGLFSAGSNIEISVDGTISATGSTYVESDGTITAAGQLPLITSASSADLVPIYHSGTEYAISVGNFVDGITIEEADAAGAAVDTDTFWTAQSSNTMSRQTLSGLWTWISGKLPTYCMPAIEITASLSLSTCAHNGHILICSQPVTLSAASDLVGGNFSCSVINVSSGNVMLGTGFVTSSGSSSLLPWQTAIINSFTYSGGNLNYALISAAVPNTTIPGQVTGLCETSVTESSITVEWQQPTTGGVVSFFTVQYQEAGASSWSSSPAVSLTTSYEIPNLVEETNYNIFVVGSNSLGNGPASTTITVCTASLAMGGPPPQVSGVVATALSASSIMVSWAGQSGPLAATSYRLQYRLSGSSNWSFSVTGISSNSVSVTNLQAATSYDFCVTGSNASGSGPASGSLSCMTDPTGQQVTSIIWNLLPTGSYTHGSGEIGVNAYVTPAASPIQFGFSNSATICPSSWTTAVLVNTNLWGAYVPAPPTAGVWYVWAEGLDGSAIAVENTGFTVS